jgi:hypothetical protein
MNSSLKKFIFIFSIAIQMSCKKGIPEIESLHKLSGFSLDQSVINLKSKSNTQVFTISGQCDTNISQIEISFDQKKFESLSIYSNSQSVQCASSKNFSFSVDPTQNTQFNLPDSSNSKILYIRGSGDLGYTSLFTISLQYIGSSENRVTAGSGVQSNGVHILKGRIQTSNVSSSGSYILKGSIKVK